MLKFANVVRQYFQSGRLEWFLLVVAGFLPICCYTYLPSTDLPQHLGIAKVVYRLLQSDPIVQQFYALNLQPVPYYLLYIILAPAVGWLDPMLANQLFLALVYWGIVLGVWQCGRLIRQPIWWMSTGIFLFYSSVFFWGFTTTLVGIPFVVWHLWGLLKFQQTQGKRFLVFSGVMGALACASHGILLLSCGAAVLGFWTLNWRQHFIPSLLLGALCALPMMPYVLIELSQGWSQPISSQGQGKFFWETPISAWNHLRLHFSCFDRSWGRTSHQGLVLLTVFTLGWGRFPGQSQQRLLLIRFVLLNVLLFLLVPLEFTTHKGLWAWLLNVRYLILAELGLLLLANTDVQAWPGRLLRGLTPLMLAVFVVFVHRYVIRFQEHVRPFEQIVAAIEPNKTMQVHKALADNRVLRAWPPVLLNLPSYLLAHGLAYQSEGFEGGHLPIRVHHQPQLPSLEGIQPSKAGQLGSEMALAQQIGQAHQATQPLQAEGNVVSHHYDYVLVQGRPASYVEVNGRPDLRLRVAAGLWSLYERVESH